MRFWVVPSLTAAALACCAPPAEAQRHSGPQQLPWCGSETTTDACVTQTTADLLERLNLPTAESLADQGYSGVRIFHYDAFYNIWPAVTAISRPLGEYRRDGIVEARTIHADGHVAVLSRPIWEGGWRLADQIATAVKDRPQPESVPVWTASSGLYTPPPPCLDPPTDIVEVIGQDRVERWLAPTCKIDPAFRQAAGLWDMVAAAFPPCGHLPIERYGHGLGRLRACLMLEGSDPVSTIPVLKALNLTVDGHLNGLPVTTLFAPEVRLVIGDNPPVIGPAEVDAAVRAGALGPGWIRIIRLTGDDNQVVVHGLLNAIPPAVAPARSFTQVWTVSADGSPRMIEWRVPADADRGSD